MTGAFSRATLSIALCMAALPAMSQDEATTAKPVDSAMPSVDAASPMPPKPITGSAIPAPPDGKSVDKPAGWQTWTWAGNCFAVDYAKGPAIQGVNNGDTYIAIKHLPRERNYDNVSIVSGLPDITGAQGTLSIAGEDFPLLVYGNAGFVRSGDPEKKLIELLGRSTEATVTWYLKDGLAVQNYDVAGFAAAKRTIDVGCPRPGTPEAALVAVDAKAMDLKPTDDKPAPTPAPAPSHKRHHHR